MSLILLRKTTSLWLLRGIGALEQEILQKIDLGLLLFQNYSNIHEYNVDWYQSFNWFWLWTQSKILSHFQSLTIIRARWNQDGTSMVEQDWIQWESSGIATLNIVRWFLMLYYEYFQLPYIISRGIILIVRLFTSLGGRSKGFNNGVRGWQWFPTGSRWRRFKGHKLFSTSYEVCSTLCQF